MVVMAAMVVTEEIVLIQEVMDQEVPPEWGVQELLAPPMPLGVMVMALHLLIMQLVEMEVLQVTVKMDVLVGMDRP
jgi:succinate-acetate transporter protein